MVDKAEPLRPDALSFLMGKRMNGVSIALLSLGLAACGSGAGESNETAPANEAANLAAAAPAETADAAAGAAKGPQGCPFRKTTGWIGSIERGYLRVNGDVDLMMAGFKPQLTLGRGGGAGVTRLELALVPEPQADVSSHVKLERAGVAPNGRAEVWCSGERIAAFDMVVVR